jgi:hypothetical protein
MREELKRAAYEKPCLVVHGTLEEITHGTDFGESLDADFPAGTPRGELGFS